MRVGPALAAIALPVGLAAARATGASPPAPAIVVAQVPAAALPADAPASGRPRAPLGEAGRIVLVRPGGASRLLTAGFASAADPEVSFDGKSILFAGKKAATDPWCVWEMQADGTALRQVTCGKAGARQPVYQPTIYTITPTNVEPWVQVAFVGENPGERNEAGDAANTSLWTCRTDGSALRRVTFNLSNDLDPVALPDGRMVYAAWLRSSRDPEGRVALVGVNADGTDYQVYAGDAGGRVKRMPATAGDGLVVFVEADRASADGAGRLASVKQVRPMHTYRAITTEADGRFRAPAPLPDGRVLVAWRAGAGSLYGIHRVDPATGAREPVFEETGWHSVQAKALVPRPAPDARSSVVREDDPQGRLFAIDVGIHDLGDRLPRGVAKSLRVVEGVPASAGAPAGKRLLGTIPIAADGSFQVQVPANTPVQLQLLDADGLAMRSSAWIWVRNHAAQGCVGCHEDPERTPPNRFAKALAEPAPVLDLPPERRRVVSFGADVRPVVEAKCLACHGEGGKGPRLDTTAGGLTVLAAPGEARRSRLLWHLLGRNTARPWDAESGTPAPPVATGLTAEELRVFVEWIDLGGQP